jgi:hypothetical protein
LADPVSGFRKGPGRGPGEIEKLAAGGYLTEPGLPLGAVVETFISDTLAQMTVTP